MKRLMIVLIAVGMMGLFASTASAQYGRYSCPSSYGYSGYGYSGYGNYYRAPTVYRSYASPYRGYNSPSYYRSYNSYSPSYYRRHSVHGHYGHGHGGVTIRFGF